MKISDITQRSQVQHIAEGRKQLDEVGLIGMGIGGGASYALLAAEYGTDISKWPMAALGEFAADIGLGALTGGTLTLAKVAAKAAMKTAAKKGLSSVAKGAGRITGKGKGPGTVNKDTGKLRGADGKDTTIKQGDKGFDKARDQIKQSRQRPDDGIPSFKKEFGKEFGKQVKGKGVGKQLSRGVAFSPIPTTYSVNSSDATGEPTDLTTPTNRPTVQPKQNDGSRFRKKGFASRGWNK
jgi:hypothetical protein